MSTDVILPTSVRTPPAEDAAPRFTVLVNGPAVETGIRVPVTRLRVQVPANATPAEKERLIAEALARQSLLPPPPLPGRTAALPAATTVPAATLGDLAAATPVLPGTPLAATCQCPPQADTPLTADKLPDDLQLLKNMILELLQKLAKSERTLEKVQLECQQLLKRLYGPKSEKMGPEQFALFPEIQAELAALLANGEPLTAPPAAMTPANEADTKENKQKKKHPGHGRRPLSEDLPHETVPHDLTEAEKLCPCCGRLRVRIGAETRQQVDFRPAQYVVLNHVRYTYACPDCSNGNGSGTAATTTTHDGAALPTLTTAAGIVITLPGKISTVTTAPGPLCPIYKGLPTAGLLAHVIVNKYQDHLPLHRQHGIFRRHGIDLPTSTLGDWMAESGKLLKPLYQLMCALVRQAKLIHTDDTRVPMLDENLAGKTRSARMWVYIGDDGYPYIVYDFTLSRQRDGPVAFLRGFHGYLQADAYGVYDGIFAGGDVIEVACWAHARRYFVDLKTDPLALVMVAFIRQLYDVEDELKKMKTAAATAGLPPPTAEARAAYRQAHAQPVLNAMYAWMEARLAAGDILPKSALATAFGYVLNQWQALNVYTTNGDLDIDNNVAERDQRLIALGRKNWLFVGSEAGGTTAAILFSVLATCQRHGVNPFDYLRDVLQKLAERAERLRQDRRLPPQERQLREQEEQRLLADLLPDHWQAAKTPEEKSCPSAKPE